MALSASRRIACPALRGARSALLGGLMICLGTTLLAQENFVPPQPYSASRYETGWERNPFTLKTAPPTVQRESPVKDLVLYNSYSIGDKRTVILANVKTRERIKLTGNGPGPGGLVMKSYQQGESRRDSYVEVEINGETAMLRYDESFLKQMASKGGASAQQKGASNAAPKKPGDAAVAMNVPSEAPPPEQSPMQPPPRQTTQNRVAIPPPDPTTTIPAGPNQSMPQSTANRRRGFSLPKNHTPPPASR